MPDIVSAGIGAAAGLAQTVSGIINSAKAKKIAKELEKSRPKYEISQLAEDDLALAESELAGGGMSARAESAYNNLNNQQFSSSLGAILRGGGSVNNVADIYGEGQEGRQRLALLNDQMRLQQIKNVMSVRDMYRDEQDKSFEFNEWAPWADKSQANAAAREKAQNQIWGGIGTVANAGINYFGGKAQEKVYDKYFGGGNSGGGNGGVNSYWTDEYAPMTTAPMPGRSNFNVGQPPVNYRPQIQPQQLIPYNTPGFNMPQYNQLFYGSNG